MEATETTVRQPVGDDEPTTAEDQQQQQPVSEESKEREQNQLVKPDSQHETTTPDQQLKQQQQQRDQQTVAAAKAEDKEEKKSNEDSKLLQNKQSEEQPTTTDRLDDDGFVIIDPGNTYRLEKYKISFLAQMEKYLSDQVNLCEYYKKLYEDQKNATMANLFTTHLLNSNRDLDLIRVAIKNNENLPKYKIETVAFNGVPINVDVKERELQLVIRTNKLPVAENAQVYVIGEFSFAIGDQTLSDTISRWFHHVKVEPQNLFCCSADASRQLDMIYSTDRKPFTNPSSEWLEFDRPLLFTVIKGKSRTHKRKFKPIKLTFYERTNLLKSDKKIGAVQLKVDAINDEARISMKQVIMNGRKDTGAYADVQIKVWKPLVENTIRAHEEKLLILS